MQFKLTVLRQAKRQFKPTALHALGFLEIFKVGSPLKVCYSTESKKIIILQTVYKKIKLSTV